MMKQLPDGTFRLSLRSPDGVKHTWFIADSVEAGFVHSTCKAAWYPKRKNLSAKAQKQKTNP